MIIYLESWSFIPFFVFLPPQTFDQLWWTWSWHNLGLVQDFNSLYIKFVLSHPSFSRLSKKFEVNIFYLNRTLWHTPISWRREEIKLFLFWSWWKSCCWFLVRYRSRGIQSPSLFLHLNKVSTPSEQELANQIADWIPEYYKNFSRTCLSI